MKCAPDLACRLSAPFILFCLIFTLLVQNTCSQQFNQADLNKTYQITLKDGSTISGKVILDTGNEIIIQSPALGELHVQKENIRSMIPVAAINEKANGLWFENPNPTKYLLGSSAIPPEKNTGYYQNTWIFVNTFNYAFTNSFSVSGGFEIISLIAGGEGPYAFFINPKMSFKVADNFYAGGSILYANTLRTIEDFGGLATFNAFVTYGNKNNNLTGAIGWGSADGRFSSSPLVTISGMVRASKRIAFVSENWIIPGASEQGGYYGIISYGIRFLSDRTSIDLAFINSPDIASDIFIGIPWLDFVINF
jgi:hypothetical protein